MAKRIPVMVRLRKFAPEGGPDECWPFTGNCIGGYGMIKVGRKNRLAHRVVYADEYGPIEPGLDVCHRCDNPPCTNPAHLFAGTQLDNMQDAMRKGRLVRGETHPKAKLSEFDIRYIRTMHGAQKCYGVDLGATKKQLAGEFGIERAPISSIISRRCWKHLAAGSEIKWIPKGMSKGEDHRSAKLSEFQVRYIRTMYVIQKRYGVDLGAKQSRLAGEFGVSPQNMSNIVHRKIWKNLAPVQMEM